MKEPIAPVYLLSARILVSLISKETEDAARQVKFWHDAVKKWQDGDDLHTAFEEGRLTLRQMTHEPQEKIDFREAGLVSKTDLSDEANTRHRVLGLINNDNYQRNITNTGKKEDKVWVKGAALDQNQTVRLDAGGAGILRRGNSANFGGSSQKNTLGLHSLSASLLNPDGFTPKRYTGVTLVAMMPLPLPRDVEIFYKLRDMARQGGCNAFRAAVATLGSEFTRPQLASSLDMGTTYVVDTSRGKTSVRYVKGTGPFVTSKETPEQCRDNAVENYRRILKDDKANEITVAYRQWGTKRHFPVFALKDGDADYTEVLIKLVQSQRYADYEATGRMIDRSNFRMRLAARV